MESVVPFSRKAQVLKVGSCEPYKGKRYRVLASARYNETLKELTVYQQLDREGGVWVRPLALFLETTNGVPRFRFIE